MPPNTARYFRLVSIVFSFSKELRPELLCHKTDRTMGWLPEIHLALPTIPSSDGLLLLIAEIWRPPADGDLLV